MNRGRLLLATAVLSSGCVLPSPYYRQPPPPPRVYYTTQWTPGAGFVPHLLPPPPVAAVPASWGLLPTQGVPNPFGNLPVPIPQGLPGNLGGLAGAFGQLGTQAYSTFTTPPPRFVRKRPKGPGCGSIQHQGVDIPLDCLTPGYGEIPWASRHVYPRSAMRMSDAHVGSAPRPSSVDHRQSNEEGVVRDQNRLGACTAFSLAAAVDHAMIRAQATPPPTSALHLWSRYHTPKMLAAVQGNINLPLTAESTWSYTRAGEREACSWSAPSACSTTHQCSGGTCVCTALDPPECGQPVRADEMNQANAAPVAKIVSVVALNNLQDKLEFMDVLAKGQDIWFSMRVGDGLQPSELLTNYHGFPYVIADYAPEEADGGHAILLSGYRVTPEGVYFLIHNSWGEWWGERGYAWIHETTLAHNITSAYVVDAAPWDPSKGKTLPPNPSPSQCPADRPPDSVTGECVPACPDGSPRSNRVCAQSNACGPGLVNVFGVCVVAPPVVPANKDPNSGIVRQCAPGGCTYMIPMGVMGCPLPWCSVSCTAPKTSLTAGPNGAGCSE